MKSVTDLECWQACFELAAAVYEASRTWPRHELHSLTSQARRAASSAPANIAEGYGRFSTAEARRYCVIAHGSLWELDTHLRLAHRLGYLDEPAFTRLHRQAEDARRRLGGYLKWLESRP